MRQAHAPSEPLAASGVNVGDAIGPFTRYLRAANRSEKTVKTYTDAARQALAGAPEGFKIALIHSPELADAAAENGYQLYLAGHTHGGQVCLPGGWPIITHMNRYRRYARGLWRHGDMRGYTSTGVGVSGLPVRFNTRGEVALITLRSGSWK